MEEVEFFKICKLSEDDHIHNAHKNLPNPEAFYTPPKFVSVSEIFFDLVFVGVASNLAHGLRQGHQTWQGFFQYMIILLTFWKDFTLNQSLFSVGDFIDKCSAFFYGIGIIGCATMSFYGPLGDFGTAFGIVAIYVCICQLCLNSRGLYGMYHAIKHKNKSCHREESTLFCMKMQLFKNTGMTLFWIIFACDAGRQGLIWVNMILPILFDFAIAIYLQDVIFDFNPNVHHYNERFEAIILIMLGETVLGIIPNIHPLAEGCKKRTIGTIVMGYVTLFLYKIFHFDVEEYEGHTHAVYIGGIHKFIWTYAMIFECVGIVLFGASIGELVEGIMEEENSIFSIRKSNVMMAAGMSVALAGNLISRLCHKIELEEFEYAWALWIVQNGFQLVAISLIIPLPFLFSDALLLKSPWVRSIYVSAILFILNSLFFIDEILEHRYLKNLIDIESKHDTQSIKMSVKPEFIPTKNLKKDKKEIENHGSKEIENL